MVPSDSAFVSIWIRSFIHHLFVLFVGAHASHFRRHIKYRSVSQRDKHWYSPLVGGRSGVCYSPSGRPDNTKMPITCVQEGERS
ncbi:hypothetical protein JB92DRAFT_3268813 [Gautieria morchelliformis]|nr:hypothetical protein JB92DRAFT_3268813 [Gautieria morchelliformis]